MATRLIVPVVLLRTGETATKLSLSHLVTRSPNFLPRTRSLCRLLSVLGRSKIQARTKKEKTATRKLRSRRRRRLHGTKRGTILQQQGSGETRKRYKTSLSANPPINLERNSRKERRETERVREGEKVGRRREGAKSQDRSKARRKTKRQKREGLALSARHTRRAGQTSRHWRASR